jgi:tripartite-type tricarboxylate transporter receptor subunit TctC
MNCNAAGDDKEHSMQRRHFLHVSSGAALSGALACVSDSQAQSQAFPERPLRLVVPFAAGGPTDSFARIYTQALSLQLGQTVVVENKARTARAFSGLE